MHDHAELVKRLRAGIAVLIHGHLSMEASADIEKCLALYHALCVKAADAIEALAVRESAIRSEERERAAKIADDYANRMLVAADRRAALGNVVASSKADAGKYIAAAIRGGDNG